MNNYNKLDSVITDAIKKMSEIADVNMIVGSPMKVDDATVVPISKITVAFLSGGGEYGDVSILKKDNNHQHSGASGGVVQIKPTGFLVNSKNGVNFVHCPNDALEKVVDICDDWVKSVNEK